MQRGLAGADQQQAAAEIGADMFGDFLNVVGPLDLLADELLDLVHHQQRTRQLPSMAEDLLDDGQCIVNGGGVVVLELVADGRLGVGGGGVFGLGCDERVGQGHRQFQAQNFAAELAALLLQCRLDFGLQPG